MRFKIGDRVLLKKPCVPYCDTCALIIKHNVIGLVERISGGEVFAKFLTSDLEEFLYNAHVNVPSKHFKRYKAPKIRNWKKRII